MVLIILILDPNDDDKSVIAEVGSPPSQKKASIFLSFKAFTDSTTDRRCLLYLSVRPKLLIILRDVTSVPLPGEPTDTFLFSRSVNFSIPEFLSVTRCTLLRYSIAKILRSIFLSYIFH